MMATVRKPVWLLTGWIDIKRPWQRDARPATPVMTGKEGIAVKAAAFKQVDIFIGPLNAVSRTFDINPISEVAIG
jgi:hypothetical protein